MSKRTDKTDARVLDALNVYKARSCLELSATLQLANSTVHRSLRRGIQMGQVRRQISPHNGKEYVYRRNNAPATTALQMPLPLTMSEPVCRIVDAYAAHFEAIAPGMKLVAMTSAQYARYQAQQFSPVSIKEAIAEAIKLLQSCAS